MAVSNSPSMSEVAAEFGGIAPHALGEYRGVRFSDGGYAPSSGTISLSHFINKSSYVPPPPPPPSGSCFSVDTKIKLESGNVINMEDVMVGDVLEGGVRVNATMQIRNINKSPFYRVFNSELHEYIYVTGDHMIKEGDEFINVSESSKSEVSTVINDLFICLITDTHTIPIGEHIFHDWSDTCDACNAKICK